MERRVYRFNEFSCKVETSKIEKETNKMYILKNEINNKKRYYKDELSFSAKAAKEEAINDRLSKIERYKYNISLLKSEIEKINLIKE